MDFTSIFGLPAHPLVVHVPVVLVPLAFIGALGLFWEPWRRRFGWATVILTGVGGVFTQLAVSSGQGLEEQVRESRALEDHIDMGEALRPWLLLFFLAVIGFLLLDRRLRARAAAGDEASARDTGGRFIGGPRLIGTFVLAVLLGAMSVYWVQAIGHSGAKATWERTQQRIDRGGGDGGGESGERGG